MQEALKKYTFLVLLSCFWEVYFFSTSEKYTLSILLKDFTNFIDWKFSKFPTKCSTLEAWKKYTLSTFGLKNFSDVRSTKKYTFLVLLSCFWEVYFFSTSEKYTLSILLEDFTNFNDWKFSKFPAKCSILEAWKKYTLSTFGLRKFSDARSTKKYTFSTSFVPLRSILF